MSLLLSDNTTIPLKNAEVGMFVKDGGEILSLNPFVTSLNHCIIDDKDIELHKAGDHFIAVYLENVHDVSSYNAYFIFRGNITDDLRSELLDRLGWNAEFIPTVEIYTSRSGISKRRQAGPILSKQVDSVYVYMK